MKQNTHLHGISRKPMRGLLNCIYGALSMCLLFVLVCMPLAPVFASELVVDSLIEIPATETQVTETSVEPESLSEEEMAGLPENEITEGEIATENKIENTGSLPQDSGLSDASPHDVTVPIDGDSVAIVSNDTEENISDGSAEDVSEETQELVEDESPEVDVSEEAPIDTEIVNTETPEEIVTPELEVPSTTPVENVVNVVTTDANRFSFSKDECTVVGNGTFYCATAEEVAQVSNTDRIFSAPDAEGDKEIYVERDGELGALTSNTYDDDATYFDELSNTAVWHRLIDGRYQIIRYDFDTEEETQLTNDRYNNMQPSAFGDTVVWQGWVGSDWEIFMLHGDELTMLTDNTTHDIAPEVNGTHIVWQAFEGDAWRMKVYDVRTGEIRTIENSDGGSIENPRFVLVYDSKSETGDVETRGYDLSSGEVMSLGAQPEQVPEEIPNPEQTGEERALVTPSTNVKQKVDFVDDTPASGDPEDDSGDVVVPSLVEIGISSTTNATLGDTENDVVVPSLGGVASTSVAHIEDVVVEPYIPEISSTTDSQSVVVGAE